MSSGISWGKVIAGAAIATGAVLLTAVVTGIGIPGAEAATAAAAATSEAGTEVAKNAGIGTLIMNEVRNIGNFWMNTFKNIGTPDSPFTKTHAALTGTALLGGGLAAYASISSSQADAKDTEMDNKVLGAHTGAIMEKRELALINGLQQGRLSLQDPQHFGGQGRGMDV